MKWSVRVLGVEFADRTAPAAISELQAAMQERDRARSVVFPNAATLNLAAADPGYRAVLNAADYVYADGTGVRWAAWMRGVRLLANLNGTDLIPALLAATPGARVYLLGSEEAVNAAAAQAVRRKYPRVTVVGRHHGYFDHDRSAEVIAAVNAAAPDLLLVGFGNPLQERWIHRHQKELHVPLIAGVGGLFGFWAGTRTRAAGLTRKIGMEWVDIMIREPSKARRYLLGNPMLLFRALRTRRPEYRS